MSILIFILVLVALIVVHEFGHFVVAKLSGMRVDEFGIGYPPRIFGFKKGETEYTLNWLPFGGFVKIFGEDMEEKLGEAPVTRDPRAFSSRPRILQALTLFAGIAMNLLFAYVLITATLVMGTPRALTAEELPSATAVEVAVAGVLPGSPAETAGLVAGDYIVSASTATNSWSGTNADAFTAFVVGTSPTEPITLNVKHGSEMKTLTATPVTGLIESDTTRSALGVQLAVVGVVPVSIVDAPVQGFLLTTEITKQTAIALVHFFGSLVTFTADLTQVSGPIGIAGAVGSATSQGLASLLSITALISINLALINLLPIPALDGGRLLFVLIEAVTRRPIKPSIANAVNTIGFGLLVLLMLIVSAHDVFKIVG
jgi:regulator of sigma E protease